MDERAMIVKAAEGYGYNITDDDFKHDDEDRRDYAVIGTGEAMEDYEDEGVFAGDHGELRAQCVGAAEYGNLHVAWYFVPEDSESPLRVPDPTYIELE